MRKQLLYQCAKIRDAKKFELIFDRCITPSLSKFLSNQLMFYAIQKRIKLQLSKNQIQLFKGKQPLLCVKTDKFRLLVVNKTKRQYFSLTTMFTLFSYIQLLTFLASSFQKNCIFDLQ